jgi:GH15 family glucan-1,4-alpha-glucosidase
VASRFAGILGEDDKLEYYGAVSERIQAGILKHLYSERLGRFIRGLKVNRDGSYEEDTTLESSCWAVFAFHVLPADDQRVVSTMQAIKEGLWVKTRVGGIARYEDDGYFQKSKDVETIPGNPWIICTLWLAQWYIAIAKSKEDLSHAAELLLWGEKAALNTGILPEQLHPLTGETVSVTPLTWSHGTYVATVCAYIQKHKEITDITCQW